MSDRLCLTENVWMAFDRTDDDKPWEFIDTVHSDDPDSAARQGCVAKWASGTHPILVVSMTEAREYRITIETESA